MSAVVDPSPEHLELALRAAHMGPWEWDASTDLVTLSARAAEIIGAPVGISMTWTEMTTHLVPDDRDRVRAAVVNAVLDRTDYEVEYRVTRLDGGSMWIAATGRVVYAADGTPLRMLGLLQDITARKQVELDRQRERRALDDFIAMLAHELRNPLAAVTSAIEILGQTQSGDPRFVRALAIARRQVAHQTRLVDDLLDAGRIARGLAAVSPLDLDLREVAHETVDDHRDRIESAGIVLEVDTPDGRVLVSADRVRLVQVFGNLLDNARKFTAAGGTVRVRIHTTDTHAVAAVSDTGIGIDAEVIRTLFSPFMQAEQTLARTRGGLGLGLSVVRGIVEMHAGGSDTAHSEGVGHGAEFRVRLPLVRRVPDAT